MWHDTVVGPSRPGHGHLLQPLTSFRTIILYEYHRISIYIFIYEYIDPSSSPARADCALVPQLVDGYHLGLRKSDGYLLGLRQSITAATGLT